MYVCMYVGQMHNECQHRIIYTSCLVMGVHVHKFPDKYSMYILVHLVLACTVNLETEYTNTHDSTYSGKV